MRPTIIAGCAAGLALASAAMTPALAQPANPPLTVVELFTSQGCSSCPPADANVARLIDRPDVLALSFGVTYWDYLGWKDTFATKAYTDRQWDYAHRLHHEQVWTPQVVVNGKVDVVGATPGEIERTFPAARVQGPAPMITLSGASVTVASAQKPDRPAQVWMVRYDPAVIQVPIKRGENNGKTLPHRNVVKELVRLGAFDGASTTLALPKPTRPDLKTAILVQAGSGGPILAAAKG